MIVLDTQSWLWYMHCPEKLSQKAQLEIEKFDTTNTLLVSAISAWEIALKVSIGKLNLQMDINSWYEETKTFPSVKVEPVIASDLINSTQLPGNFHKDPADRIIVSFARRLGCPVITSDSKILEYQHVQAIW